MKYAYEDLNEYQFEELVEFICKKLLGASVQGFALGKDGGRDAKFIGTAELHPSKASPWVGITIIQAKHTNGVNRTFSEKDFFNPESSNSIVSKEIPKIQQLVKDKDLNNYMLFANRRLTAITENEMRKNISEECSIPLESIFLCGLEGLESFLKAYPDITEMLDLDMVDSPLIISPDELAEVVQALARHKKEVSGLLGEPPVPRVNYEEKNAINNMTPAYAKEQRRRYLKETAMVRDFLASPENDDIRKLYESVVSEFQLKLVSKRKDYQAFDEVMEYMINLLFGRDAYLRQHGNKKLTRTILFYMYWNCDLGESDGD